MAHRYKNERNQIGVDDMVMLSNISEQSMLDNLQKRYKEKQIYTLIGKVLISMNPYTDLQLTTPQFIQKYHEEDNFHIPPHIFTITNDAYRALIAENESQAIIISGESGAGKTEASKGIMQYLAAISGKQAGANVERIKNVILESNPLLESFGNAKTLRNNNSSRFGKYIEIQFDYKGDPEGGRVQNYLLEKSRIISQTLNERSFHIFYQLFHLNSTDQQKLKLNGKSPEHFQYLNKSNCTKVDGIDDKKWLEETIHAMGTLNIGKEEQDQIFSLLSGVLYLGNLIFKGKGFNESEVANHDVLKVASELLKIEEEILQKSLTWRGITAGRTSGYAIPLIPSKAEFTRDAFAKAIFGRLFDWLVSKINSNIEIKTPSKNIGILDIYGFEIFQTNSFEQLCINYCNETLHQIFIDLTLKAEQEEYVREGIKWEPIAFVNNKPCVELLQNKPMGIYCILDEECLLDNRTDKMLLDKMNSYFGKHSHYKISTDLKLKDKSFTIVHYAGEVTYDVNGFLEKNRDTLFNDVLEAASCSRNPLLHSLFSSGNSVPLKKSPFKGNSGAKERPTTAGDKFKKSMQMLLATLYSCQPHYVRCIKPNENKKALGYDDTRVREQLKYLGLFENLKVARAGFCYKQTYEKWISRYNLISDLTFPRWKGSARDAVELLVTQELKLPSNEYQMGATKLFLRSPQTLFDVEERRLAAFHRIATKIQSVWRSWKIRKIYIELRRESMDVFKGQKERTRMSMARGPVSFFGDFLGLQNSPDLQIIQKGGDSKILFSDRVNKVNPKYKIQQRGLILGEKNIYNVKFFKKPKKGVNFEIRRQTRLADVDSVSVSRLADDFMVVHIGKDYDYVFESSKKTVFVTLLKKQLRKDFNRTLDVNVVESIAYKIRKGRDKALNFEKDETLNSASKKVQKGVLNIKISSGIKQ